MESPYFLFAIVLLVATVVGLMVQWRQSTRLDRAFQHVAREHQGRFVPGGMRGRPSVRFTHQGVPVLLDTFSTGGESPKYFTQLHLAWPEPKFRMEVFPEGVVSQLGKLFGAQDIEIGSPEFDRKYVIRGNNEHRIAEILTLPVQTGIESLRLFPRFRSRNRFRSSDDLYVAARAGTLLIKKRLITRDPLTLGLFVSLGLELYEGLAITGSQGIQFVDLQSGSEWPATTHAICQVCGEAINSEVVYCKSCKTPHHEECWVYFGACSTYGCGQKKFVRPRKQRRGA